MIASSSTTINNVLGERQLTTVISTLTNQTQLHWIASTATTYTARFTTTLFVLAGHNCISNSPRQPPDHAQQSSGNWKQSKYLHLPLRVYEDNHASDRLAIRDWDHLPDHNMVTQSATTCSSFHKNVVTATHRTSLTFKPAHRIVAVRRSNGSPRHIN